MKTPPTKWMALGGLAAILAFTTLGHAADPAPAANTGTVTGIVRGQDGQPAANATVKLAENAKGFRPDQPKPEAKPAKGDKKKASALSATTDADGKFKIENVPAGQYKVTASIPKTSRGNTNVAVKAGETTDVAISMHAAK